MERRVYILIGIIIAASIALYYTYAQILTMITQRWQ
jgi:hypothetical protein